MWKEELQKEDKDHSTPKSVHFTKIDNEKEKENPNPNSKSHRVEIKESSFRKPWENNTESKQTSEREKRDVINAL